MAPSLKHFDGLWRALRGPSEVRQDRQLEDHEDNICDEGCPFCDDIENMVKYFTKQTEGEK